MKVNEIAEIIERYAPREIAMPYDNVGLLIGDGGAEVTGVIAAVDLTDEVIEKALKIGANLIITHHPIIFGGINTLLASNYEQGLIASAARHSLNVYACHTNADNASTGLNYALALRLGGTNIQSLGGDGGVTADCDCDAENLIGIVRREVKGVIKTDVDLARRIKRFALITGSGGRDGELVYKLKRLGVDCFMTAEVAHHVRLAFIANRVGLIEFGHYESERIFIDVISGWLSKSGLKIDKAFNSAFSN